MPVKKARRKQRKLTDKQENFCIYVADGMKQTDAAIKAKYAKGSAHVSASENMANHLVVARIDELRGKKAKTIIRRREIKRDEVIDNLFTLYDKAVSADRIGDATNILKLMGLELNMFQTTQRNIEVPAWTEGLSADVLRVIEGDPDTFCAIMNKPQAFLAYLADFEAEPANDTAEHEDMQEAAG